jgi:hypothetical protein
MRTKLNVPLQLPENNSGAAGLLTTFRFAGCSGNSGGMRDDGEERMPRGEEGGGRRKIVTFSEISD